MLTADPLPVLPVLPVPADPVLPDPPDPVVQLPVEFVLKAAFDAMVMLCVCAPASSVGFTTSVAPSNEYLADPDAAFIVRLTLW